MSSLSTSAEHVRRRIEESVAVKRRMIDDDGLVTLIAEVADRCVEALRDGKKVIFCGNGGSAADSQHLAAELVGKFYLSREPLAAVSLTVNTSSLTAVGNDFGYDEVFEKQMKGLGQPGDVAIGISTSGNSANVIRALDVAKAKGIVTVAFTGSTGGKLAERVDYCLKVPSDDTARIQEAHITAGHILCELVERTLFSNES